MTRTAFVSAGANTIGDPCHGRYHTLHVDVMLSAINMAAPSMSPPQLGSTAVAMECSPVEVTGAYFKLGFTSPSQFPVHSALVYFWLPFQP
jgi:hypothetical protein